jgi:transposase
LARGELAKVSGGYRIAQPIRYALKHWAGLTVFLHDGRVEIDFNVVERSIRTIALNRKNALFAGSDQGGVDWGVIASLIETCKLNAVDPQAYLASTLTRPISLHPRQPNRPAHALGLRPSALNTALTPRSH